MTFESKTTKTLAYLGYVTFFAALSIMILIGLHLGYHIFFVSKNALEINKDFIRIKKSQFDFEQYTFYIHRTKGIDNYIMGRKQDSAKEYNVLSMTTFELDYEDVVQELRKYINLDIEETV